MGTVSEWRCDGANRAMVRRVRPRCEGARVRHGPRELSHFARSDAPPHVRGSPRASGTIALRRFGRTAARSRFAAGLANYRTSHVRTHRRTFAVRRGPRELSHFARSDAPPHVRGSPRASGTIALRTFGRTAARSRFAAGLGNYRTSHFRTHRRTFARLAPSHNRVGSAPDTV